MDFTRWSSGALGQRALPELLAAQGRDGWPSRPHMWPLPWMTWSSAPLGPLSFQDKDHSVPSAVPNQSILSHLLRGYVFDPVIQEETERFLQVVEGMAVEKLPVPQTWSDPAVKLPDNVQVVMGLADMTIGSSQNTRTPSRSTSTAIGKWCA